MQTYCHKRGDTFGLAGPGTLPPGTWMATAQVRDPRLDALVDQLDVQLVAQPNGTFTHALTIGKDAAYTALWPIGLLVMDVQFVDAFGLVRSTQTVTLKIIKDVTYG